MLKKKPEKQAIARFTEVYDFVDFGRIHNNDGVERLHGVTFTRESKDTRFMHTNINGYEVSFLIREATHSPAHHVAIDTYWSVLSVELLVSGLPHIIFDNKKHDKHFYQSVFTMFPRLRSGKEILRHLQPTAESQFDVYLEPHHAMQLPQLFSDEMLQRMAQYYAKFDVEIQDNRLFIFSRGTPQSYVQLNEMLQEALWLTERIEMRADYQPADTAQETADLRFVTT